MKKASEVPTKNKEVPNYLLKIHKSKRQNFTKFYLSKQP